MPKLSAKDNLSLEEKKKKLEEKETTSAIKKFVRKRMLSVTLPPEAKVASYKAISNLDAFLREFVKNGGNATGAVQKVFGVKSPHKASSLGHHYITRAKHLGMLYMDTKGATYGKFLDLAIKKAEESNDPAWWDRLMKIAGYEDFLSKTGFPPTYINILQGQRALANKFGFEEGEVVEEGEGKEEKKENEGL